MKGGAGKLRVVLQEASEGRCASGDRDTSTRVIAGRSGAPLVRALHERARDSRLSPDELHAYSEAFADFIDKVLADQNRRVQGDQKPRRAPRVSRSVGVELSWSGATQRVVTLDLGPGGFSAILPKAPPPTEPVQARLLLRRREHMGGYVKVTSVRGRRGSARVSFAFERMDEADRRRLEAYVADELLAHVSYRSI